uniref:Putative secreted peptide n=1 Tax=Anopheles braziliensis TaxID=58242 RepID=A0A2M3ZNT6_9DIPT
MLATHFVLCGTVLWFLIYLDTVDNRCRATWLVPVLSERSSNIFSLRFFPFYPLSCLCLFHAHLLFKFWFILIYYNIYTSGGRKSFNRGKTMFPISTHLTPVCLQERLNV